VKRRDGGELGCEEEERRNRPTSSRLTDATASSTHNHLSTALDRTALVTIGEEEEIGMKVMVEAMAVGSGAP